MCIRDRIYPFQQLAVHRPQATNTDSMWGAAGRASTRHAENTPHKTYLDYKVKFNLLYTFGHFSKPPVWDIFAVNKFYAMVLASN